MTDRAPNVFEELLAEYEHRKKVRETALTPPSFLPSVEPPRRASLGQAWKNPENGEIYMAFLPNNGMIKWVCMSDPLKSPIFVAL